MRWVCGDAGGMGTYLLETRDCAEGLFSSSSFLLICAEVGGIFGSEYHRIRPCPQQHFKRQTPVEK